MLAGGGEDDGLLGEAGRAGLEQLAGVGGLEPADVDAVDPYAARDLRRRAGEDEPEDDRGRDEREGQEHEATQHCRDGSGGLGNAQGDFSRRRVIFLEDEQLDATRRR